MLTVASSSYPFLKVLWDILIITAWIIYIWLAITVFIDLFRRRDISGWAKAFWVIFVVILPWIGVLVYLIAYHDGMATRNEKESQAAQAAFDTEVREAAGKSGPATEIDTAQKLLDAGTITQEEFDTIKARALSSTAGAR
jgi:Short C-terminal domain/Phospholipase_D-nuclease N-terminal